MRRARRSSRSLVCSACSSPTSRKDSARTMWRRSTWQGVLSPKGYCSSARPRRRPRCSAPPAGSTPRPASAILGSRAARPCPTTITSTSWMRTSGRCLSSSARTSPMRSRCASMATSGSSASSPRRASPSLPSTTVCSGARTPSGCSNCARSWTPRRSKRCFASGWRGCLTPFARRTGKRVTDTRCPSCRPSSRSPKCSIAPRR